MVNTSPDNKLKQLRKLGVAAYAPPYDKPIPLLSGQSLFEFFDGDCVVVDRKVEAGVAESRNTGCRYVRGRPSLVQNVLDVVADQVPRD